MFDIEYKGGNTIVITTKKTTLVFDPKASSVGLKDVVVKDSVELLTDQKSSVINDDAKLVISVPGEYGVGDVDVVAIAANGRSDSDKTNSSVIYKLIIGEHRVVVFGNIDEKLNDLQLEKIGTVDILIIPVGNHGYTLDSIGASKIIKNIEPKIVIPIHYDDGVSKYEVPQDKVEVFLKELDATPEKTSKLKIKSGHTYLPGLTVVVLEVS